MIRFFRQMLCLAIVPILVFHVSATEYKYNGGHRMPSLGLGTFMITNYEEHVSILNKALEIGYRHIDTASIYENEKLIGKVLKEWLSCGKLKREDILVTTKLHMEDTFSDRVEKSLNLSLEKLQLEYVDLYLIHFPVAMNIVEGDFVPQPTDIISVWKEMEAQVRSGRAKTIGISNFNISQIERIQKIAKIQPTCLQVEAHLYFQQRKIRDFCKIKNITVVAFSPLGAPGRVKELREESIHHDILKDPVVKAIAEKHKKSAAQVALRFLFQSGWAVIPKSSNPERLAENFNIFDFTLDNEDIKSLEKLDKGKDGRIGKMTE